MTRSFGPSVMPSGSPLTLVQILFSGLSQLLCVNRIFLFQPENSENDKKDFAEKRRIHYNKNPERSCGYYGNSDSWKKH